MIDKSRHDARKHSNVCSSAPGILDDTELNQYLRSLLEAMGYCLYVRKYPIIAAGDTERVGRF